MAFHAHDLPASLRHRSGSGRLGQMRREGFTPGIFYGKETDNKNIKVETKVLFDLLHRSASENLLVNLAIESEGEHLALIHEVQHEPLSGEILHVDFLAVTRGQTMNARVPLVIVGSAKGVKAGGVLSNQVDELAITCRPSNLPEKIEVDVSELEIGEAIHVSDLSLPEGVEADVDGAVVIARVAPPILEEESEPEAGTDGASEPEVIGGRDDEEKSEEAEEAKAGA